MIDHTETLEQLRDERDHYKAALAELTGAECETLPGLTRGQSRIVRALEQAGGRALSHDALMHALTWDRYGKDEPESNIVGVHIARIRKARPDLAARLVTVWGEGYRLLPEGEPCR